MKIHHLGYLVENMDAAIDRFLKMGGGLVKDSIYDKERLIDIAFLEIDNLVIELVCSHKGSQDIGESIRRLKTAPYHLCFECHNLEEEIKNKVELGDMLVKDPQKAVAIDDKRVAFMYSESIGLYEMVEEKKI